MSTKHRAELKLSRHLPNFTLSDHFSNFSPAFFHYLKLKLQNERTSKSQQKNQIKVCKPAKRRNLRYLNVRRGVNASWLHLVFLSTLLLCPSCFLRASQQNRAQSTLLYQLKKIYQIHPCNFVHLQYIQADIHIHVIQWCSYTLHPRDKTGFRRQPMNIEKQQQTKIHYNSQKASEIIDRTWTVASISSISRFACANVWSVRVVTISIHVTFVGVCFAFVNICQKEEKIEKNNYRDLVFIQKSYMYIHGILVYNFFVSCDSRVGPASQTVIFEIFSRCYSKDYLSSVDSDLYPYHNVLPRIQEDISIDIPWVWIQTGKMRYFRSWVSCHKRSKDEEKWKGKEKRNTEWWNTRKFEQ